MLAFLLLACLFNLARGEAADTNGAISLSFDGDVKKSAGNMMLKQTGGKIISGGISGGALRLLPGEFLILDATRLIDPSAGSVSFWVRPHWDDTDPASHTFISFPWLDGKNGYFIVSRGWWEPDGSGLTYLIGNNQDYSNQARKIRFEKGVWTHIAVVWQGGHPGYVKLYVNGLLASQDKRYTGTYKPGKQLYLGSDLGTPLSNKRWADADFDELAFFKRTLSGDEVRNHYDRLTPLKLESPSDAEGRHQETRAIFDEGDGWQTESGARETIRRVKRAGFNVYVPCVWHGNGARYPTSFTEGEQGKKFIGRDPLERLISIAHDNGIQVYPWFTVALREKWFAQRHKEFHDPSATPADAFDLHRPAFRTFMTGLIADVAMRYPIDGVNLDFIRTMGTCRCKSCVDEYRQRYQRDLVNDAAHPKKDGTLAVHLQEWQDEAVEAVVSDVSGAVRQFRPGGIISVAGNPQSYPSQEGRQEALWANKGLVDLVFDMEYADPPDVERHHLVSAQFNDPGKLVMLVSNHDWKGGRPVPKEARRLNQNADYVRGRWGRGMGVYIYSMLSDDQVEMLRQGPFNTESRPLNRKMPRGE